MPSVLPLHEEGQKRRRTHWRVLSRVSKGPGLLVHAERHDRIRALVAAVHELSGRIKGEIAWIVAARRLLSDESQRPVGCDGEPRKGVVQPVGGIDEAGIARDGPDESVASTTSTPRASPLTSRLRRGKFCFSGGVPTANSEMTRPFAARSCARARLRAG